MANRDKGYVYIFTNESFRDGWVKIGKTKNVKERLKQLDNTSCPLPFDVYATMRTSKYEDAEALVHEYISHFNNELRVRPNREYFKVSPEEALKIFFQVKRVIEDAEIDIFDEKAQKLFKSKLSQSSYPEEESTQNSFPTSVKEDIEGPRFMNKKVLPNYFAKFRSELTSQAIADLELSTPISEIRDVKTLIRIRERIKDMEKIRKYHGTHSCAISQLIEYIENGFTYQDFEYDANFVKNKKGEKLYEKPEVKTEDSFVFVSLKTLPRYLSSLKGGFIKEIMASMKITSNISDITDLSILEQIHSEILKKEKALGIHHTYSCALNQYKQYIENGYSFADMEHDANMVKTHNKLSS